MTPYQLSRKHGANLHFFTPGGCHFAHFCAFSIKVRLPLHFSWMRVIFRNIQVLGLIY